MHTRVEGCDKPRGRTVGVPVWVFFFFFARSCVRVPCEACRREQTRPPQFSLSIILRGGHTSSNMPERVSISCACARPPVCVCAPGLPCLPKECSSLYLYVCLVITYTPCTHVYQGRWSLKAQAISPVKKPPKRKRS